MFIFEIADTHHLVLPNVGHQYSVVTGRLGNLTDYLAHFQLALGRIQFLLDYLIVFLFLVPIELGIPDVYVLPTTP